MKVGLAIPANDTDPSTPTSLARLADYSMRAEDLGYDSVWLMDHFWVDREGRRSGGHDPLVALAYIASRTRHVQLGTLVACNSFRHPGQLAREAAALADACDDRFILGIGAGWHEDEYAAFGLPFDHKVDRLAETMEILPRLLRGERVTHRGRYLDIREADIRVSAPPPPIWIAAFGPRMMQLTARHAAGWNAAWFGADPTPFRRHLKALWDAMDTCGRPRDEIEISAGLFVVPGRQAQPVSARALTGETEEIAAGLHAYEEVGAQHLVLSLATVPYRLQEPGFIETVARAIERAKARPGTRHVADRVRET